MSRTCPVQDVQDIENSVGHCPTPALPKGPYTWIDEMTFYIRYKLILQKQK